MIKYSAKSRVLVSGPFIEQQKVFLFGDSEQPIMLVGSSYTKIDDWNFPGFLKESLRTDLQTTAVEARDGAVAITGRPEASMFGSFDGRTRSAAPAICGRMCTVASASSSGSRSIG